MNDSSITIISPRNLAEAKELATTLSAARTLPEALQQKPADVMAIVMAGAELGLAPMQSIRALVLIKGKPTLSADAMGALVKSRRDVCTWLRLVESSATIATYETLRNGDPGPTRLSFTIEQAAKAGLNGDNWKRFPDAMLRARALSALCRAVYPDLLLGVYDPDELDAAPAPREVNAPPVVVAPQPLPPVEAQVVPTEEEVSDAKEVMRKAAGPSRGYIAPELMREAEATLRAAQVTHFPPSSPPSNVRNITGAPSNWEVRINEAQTPEALALVASALHREPMPVREAHRAVYNRRMTELSARAK